jgi:hypothetical protein
VEFSWFIVQDFAVKLYRKSPQILWKLLFPGINEPQLFGNEAKIAHKTLNFLNQYKQHGFTEIYSFADRWDIALSGQTSLHGKVEAVPSTA